MAVSEEIRQPRDERMRDAPARVALIERSILVLLFFGLLIGVLAVVKPFTTAILFGAARRPRPGRHIRPSSASGDAGVCLLAAGAQPDWRAVARSDLGGAAWWLFAQDQQVWGMFMIVWGVFVQVIDNFIKPWLIGFGVEMPMSLTILGVFGGFIAFGFLGLFIGPTLIAIMFTLVQAWRAAVAGHPAAQAIKPAA
jgi:hypothetical protein